MKGIIRERPRDHAVPVRPRRLRRGAAEHVLVTSVTATSRVRSSTSRGGSMLLRRQGKLAFATMRDSSGEIQLFALDGVTANFEEFTKLHLGDWVGVEGEVVRTKRGELSVKVADLGAPRRGARATSATSGRASPTSTCATATARPTSGRTRPRGERSRDEATMMRAVRERCWAQGFMEVETPILNAIPSGSTARPFVTHHNALRRRLLPAHRARTLAEAARRRGLRAGLRARSGLSQRGR